METRTLPARGSVNSVQKNPEDIFDEKGEELIQFVEKHICRMNESLLFDGSRQPSFYELNRALCTYEGVLLSLTALYEDVRFKFKQSKEIYDTWFAEKSIGVRDRENLKEFKTSQWLSATEIERKTISENKEEHLKLKAEILLYDSKESTLRRLIDGWTSYQFILSNLCKNAQAELGASMASKDADEEMSLPNLTDRY